MLINLFKYKTIALIVLGLGMILLLTGCGKKLEEKEIQLEGNNKSYVIPERNFDGIRFETLRKKIDLKYNEAHDDLSAAYYDGYEFVWDGKNYGILDKDTFDKMQGKIWAEYEVLFHEENLKQSEEDKIPEEKYNKIEEYDDDGNLIETKYKDKEAKERINKYEKEGIDIKL